MIFPFKLSPWICVSLEMKPKFTVDHHRYTTTHIACMLSTKSKRPCFLFTVRLVGHRLICLLIPIVRVHMALVRTASRFNRNGSQLENDWLSGFHSRHLLSQRYNKILFVSFCRSYSNKPWTDTKQRQQIYRPKTDNISGVTGQHILDNIRTRSQCT